MRRRVPNKRLMSSMFKTMLNPWREHSMISFQQKAVEVDGRGEVWGPLAMAFQVVVRDHSGMIFTGKPWEAYSRRRGVDGWSAEAGGGATVGRWYETK